MIDRNEVMALAGKLREPRPSDDCTLYTMGQRRGRAEAATELEALAAKAEPQGGEVDPRLRDAWDRLNYQQAASKALAPLLAPGYRLIYRDAFRWKDAAGNVLSNHYDGQDIGYLAAEFDYDVAADLGFAAVIRESHPAPKPTEGEAPEAVREMLAEGWTLNYSPDTGFIGFAHPKGGRQSLLEIVRGRRDQDIGEFIVQALAAAPKKGEG